MKVIGIVGGIASGKSFVSKCLQKLGAKILDADRIGHEVLRLESVKKLIHENWGDAVFDENGEVIRSALAQSVFGSDSASRGRLVRLESISHPRIAERMREEIDALRKSREVAAVVLDAPVLIKAGWDRLCDKIVFVDAADEIRRRRAMARGWPEAEWRRREAIQPPLEEIKRRADAVIDNSSTAEFTERQVSELWRVWCLSDG